MEKANGMFSIPVKIMMSTHPAFAAEFLASDLLTSQDRWICCVIMSQRICLATLARIKIIQTVVSILRLTVVEPSEIILHELSSPTA